jgi:hypothetical protein
MLSLHPRRADDADMASDEPPIVGRTFEVTLVSGETLRVQTEVEARWFERAKNDYLAEAKFDDRTDLQDLDRLLCLELMQFRWNMHLAAGVDYEGNLSEAEARRRNLKDQSAAITQLKESMGLTKKARNALLDAGNVAANWTTLKRRAKEFGHFREEQLRTALVLMNELSAIVGGFKRADAEERKKLGFESSDAIVDWIEEDMMPRYHAVDEHFRHTVQRLWQQDPLR